MAQAFVSTYKNHFRGKCQPRSPICDPNSKLGRLEPEGDIWMVDLNREMEEELGNIPKIEEAIYKLYLKRMRSSYQVSYCDNLKHLKKPSSTEIHEHPSTERKEDEEEDLGNELLEHCKNLYSVKQGKIIPPLRSARTVFGYTRPTRLLTPLSCYQTVHGRVGYNILKQQ